MCTRAFWPSKYLLLKWIKSTIALNYKAISVRCETFEKGINERKCIFHYF